MDGQETCPMCGVDVTEEEAVVLLVDRGTIPGVQRHVEIHCPGCGSGLKITVIAHDVFYRGDEMFCYSLIQGEYQHELFVELLDDRQDAGEDDLDSAAP